MGAAAFSASAGSGTDRYAEQSAADSAEGGRAVAIAVAARMAVVMVCARTWRVQGIRDVVCSEWFRRLLVRREMHFDCGLYFDRSAI